MVSGTETRHVEQMEAIVQALSIALGLDVAPEWVPGVAQQLTVSLSMADLLDTVDLPDEAQPAPVYRLAP